MKLIALSLLAVLLNICGPVDGGDTTLQVTSFEQVTYTFADASVPPDHHRSFEIVVTEDLATRWYHSYGDTITYEEEVMTPFLWENVLNAFEEAGLHACRMMENDGCTGGTTVSVTTEVDDTTYLEGHRHTCGGSVTGNMCGDPSILLVALETIFDQ